MTTNGQVAPVGDASTLTFRGEDQDNALEEIQQDGRESSSSVNQKSHQN
jgi:hypothetical protein